MTRDVGGAVHDVIVGQDVAVRGHDDARADTLLSLLRRLTRHAELPVGAVAEELAEQRIVGHFSEELRGNFGHLRGRDIHNRREHLPHDRRETGPAGTFVGTCQLQRQRGM